MWENVLKVWAFLAPIITLVVKWLDNNREEIESIILRIQKDMQDSWTAKEREQFAVDMFFKKIYPRLPWIAKVLGKGFWEKKVRKIIARFCEKSHDLKK